MASNGTSAMSAKAAIDKPQFPSRCLEQRLKRMPSHVVRPGNYPAFKSRNVVRVNPGALGVCGKSNCKFLLCPPAGQAMLCQAIIRAAYPSSPTRVGWCSRLYALPCILVPFFELVGPVARHRDLLPV